MCCELLRKASNSEVALAVTFCGELAAADLIDAVDGLQLGPMVLDPLPTGADLDWSKTRPK